MKIAHIGLKGIPAKGGGERVAEAIVRRLSNRHDITVYCCNRYTPAEARVPGVKLIRLPTLSGKHTHMASLDVLSTAHAILYGDYDLIHVHNVETCFVLPLLRPKFKIVATSHGQAYYWDKWGRPAKFLMRLTEYPYVHLSDRITVVTPVLAQYYQEEYGRMADYVPNGIDVDTAPACDEAMDVLAKVGLGPHEYILFASGRIIQGKGCDLLLRALASLPGHLPLVMVGDFEQRPEYTRELQRLADRRTYFVPFISDKATLLGLIQQSRLFVFPSTYEAMSMMLLEVASQGVPLVCSDITQNVSVLGDRTVYFRSGDVPDLTEKLRWALDHPTEMRELARSAQFWVKENFSWDRIADRYDAIYNGLVESPRQARYTADAAIR